MPSCLVFALIIYTYILCFWWSGVFGVFCFFHLEERDKRR